MKHRRDNGSGGIMGDCELCGAMKVGTINVMMGKAQVQACKRCSDKMGLEPKKVAPGLSQARQGRHLHLADTEVSAGKERT